MSQTYFAHCRPEMIPFLPSVPQAVLEIGCGDGNFARNFPDVDQLDYWGIELDPSAGQTARKMLKHVLIGDYNDLIAQIPTHHFDLVICNDVIEHMPDTKDFLTKIKAHMKPDARLIGSIPNVRHISHLYELLIKKDWEYKSAGILDDTHLRFFTERSWRRTLEAAGFSIEKMSGINPVLMYDSRFEKRLQRLMTKLLGRDTRYLQFGFSANLPAKH
jgi:2-polyprenyl-3-methyl-5-hydroxy-6-metoxy-1,4-benzoquinol methylase